MMMIPRRVGEIAQQGGFPLWLGAVCESGVPVTSRAAGFSVDQDESVVSVHLPQKLIFDGLPHLTKESYATLLMASMITFESYQIKGWVIDMVSSTGDEIEHTKANIEKTIRIANEMNLEGQKVFQHLLEEPFLAVGIRVETVFEQTPKPNTGNKI